jgi:membrane associated rhomboid family serine protease
MTYTAGDESRSSPMPPMTLFDALNLATPRIIVTPVLMGLNILYFVVMVLGGVHYSSPETLDLLSWGASYPPNIVRGEYVRLLSATFIHIGFFHLAVNMWCLYQLGYLAERLFGNTAFIIIYLISGLGGSVAACLWTPYITTAGASGAVFGLGGAWLAFVLIQKKALPKMFYQNSINNIGFFLGLNFIIGFSVPGISNAGHFGGLVAGFAAASLLTRTLFPLREPSTGRKLAVIVASLLALTACMAVAKMRIDPTIRILSVRESELLLKKFNTYNQGLQTIQSQESKADVVLEYLYQAASKKQLELKVCQNLLTFYKDAQMKYAVLDGDDVGLNKLHEWIKQKSKHKVELAQYYQDIAKGDKSFDSADAAKMKNKIAQDQSAYDMAFEAFLKRYGFVFK